MRQRILSESTCPCCGKTYRPRRATQTTCSRKCSTRRTGDQKQVSRETRTCSACGSNFWIKASSKQRFCSHPCSVGNTSRQAKMLGRTCEWCSSQFVVPSTSPKRFCDTRCSAKWRMTLPHIKEALRASIPRSAATRRGVPRPDAAERMRKNNPMNDPEVRERVRLKLVGRTFLSRGGNGKTTPEQEALAKALNLPMEHPIPTRDARPHFPSLPPCYKVDVACLDTRVAFEVDGRTHRTKRWKFLYARKTRVLEHLGWCVLRFSNEEVRADLQSVVDRARSCMTLRSKNTTTS